MTEWVAIVPVKRFQAAKTRLGPSGERLARAFATDTVQVASQVVSRVIVVVDETGMRLPGETLVQRTPGLNGAIADGLERAAATAPEASLAVLLADLPALRAADLRAVLELAGEHPTAFVPDADGTGTTMLLARAGAAVLPAFGPGSADAYRRGGCVALEAPLRARRDVDTADDLAAALALGIGAASAAAVANVVRG